MPVQTYRLMYKVSIITINLTQTANHQAKHAVFFQLLFYIIPLLHSLLLSLELSP